MSLWNIYAFCYDSIAVLRPYRDLLRDVIEHAKVSLADRVLDVGCGTANLGIELARRVREFVGLDVSHEMVSRAREKTKQHPTCTILQADLNNLGGDLIGQRYNKIFAINLLPSIKNPAALVKLLSNLLENNGLLVIANPKPTFSIMEIALFHIKHLKTTRELVYTLLNVPGFVLLSVLNVVMSIQESVGIRKLLTLADIQKLLLDSGLRIIHNGETYAGQDHLIVAIKDN